jgi:hypothetical protein
MALMSNNDITPDTTDTTDRIAVIHPIFGEDDIMVDAGWTGIELYVAVDYNHPDDPDGLLLYADLDEQAVIDFCTNQGYRTVDATDFFVQARDGWVRRDSPRREPTYPIVLL